MQYTRLGRSGLIVSRVCFGCLTFGKGVTDIPALYKVDDALADRMVGTAIDAGVNFFDTADLYAGGESERMLGRTLRGRRHQVAISTKVGFRSGGENVLQAGLSRRRLLEAIDASLTRLGTDYVDVYIAHREDPHTELEETLEAFDQIVRAGKARYIGFSNWPAWKAALGLQMQKQHGWAQFVTGQCNYSLVERDVEFELVPFMRHAGIGMMVWSPLAGGFLTGKYSPGTAKDPDSRLATLDALPFDKTRGFAAVELMRKIAADRRATVAQVALAWLLTKPVVSSLVIGATTLAQLGDNLESAAVRLEPDEIEALDAITAAPPMYPNWMIVNMRDAVTDKALGVTPQPLAGGQLDQAFDSRGLPTTESKA